MNRKNPLARRRTSDRMRIYHLELEIKKLTRRLAATDEEVNKLRGLVVQHVRESDCATICKVGALPFRCHVSGANSPGLSRGCQ